MPGLIGVVQRSCAKEVKSVFNTILAPMHYEGRLQSEVRIAPNGQWALGRVYHCISGANSRRTETDSVQVLLHGELYNEAELRKSLQEKGIPAPNQGCGAGHRCSLPDLWKSISLSIKRSLLYCCSGRKGKEASSRQRRAGLVSSLLV